METTLKGMLKKAEPNIFDVYLKELRESEISNIILGGGGQAKKLTEYLLENSVSVDGYCESMSYWYEGKRFCERPVYPVDELNQYISECNLIIAATGAGTQRLVGLIKSMAEIKNVYVFENLDTMCDISYDWIEKHIDELSEVYDNLEDEESKQVFKTYLNTKAGGCFSDVNSKLWEFFTEQQYFNKLYRQCDFKSNVMIDCGAFIGDSAEEFFTYLGNDEKMRKIYAFEPNEDSYQKLCAVAKELGDIECYSCGVSDREETVYFSLEGSTSHISDKSVDAKIELKKGDVVLKDVPYISLVKMDLEGAEMSALRGMEKTLIKHMPMLAICVYHKTDDLLTIPTFIRQIEQKQDKYRYKYYLRIHSTMVHELVYYAVPELR